MPPSPVWSTVEVGIEYVTGDATEPGGSGTRIICHICNDIGGWGAGFVLAISRRWPDPEAEYYEWYRDRAENDFGLGAIQMVQVEDEIWVANMVGQEDVRPGLYGPPIRYWAVEKCLAKLAEQATAMDASVHMPRIGCGLAGGTWDGIEPIIERTLVRHKVPVTVYDVG